MGRSVVTLALAILLLALAVIILSHQVTYDATCYSAGQVVYRGRVKTNILIGFRDVETGRRVSSTADCVLIEIKEE